MENGPALACLELALGYTFKDKNILLTALTHPSYCLEHKETIHYQRLEFLGDAILGAGLSAALYKLFPIEREGKLAKMRSILASGATLTSLAKDLKLDTYIRMSAAEYAQEGSSRSSSLEDCLEALLGAIYLDSASFSCTCDVIHKLYGDIRLRLSSCLDRYNPKGKLQEWCQEQFSKNTLRYTLLKSEGPAHHKMFYVGVWLNDECLGEGKGLSKKEAEEAAAQVALSQLKL